MTAAMCVLIAGSLFGFAGERALDRCNDVSRFSREWNVLLNKGIVFTYGAFLFCVASIVLSVLVLFVGYR